MKIAVLHGAIINAGDFLIKNRAISLLKYFYPDSEIVEYYRNQSLEEKLPEINACDILVFAGGPGYCNGFYPRMAPVTDDLNKIKIPVMLLGMGWWEHNSDVVSQYSYQFEEPMRALFQKATEKGLKMGCRDIATVNVLRNNGYDNIAMTGCPAWYDLEHIGITRYTGKGLPSVIFKVAENQGNNIAGWKNIGFVDEFIDATKDWHIDDLDKIILKFENSEYRREIFCRGISQIDGKGAHRIMKAVTRMFYEMNMDMRLAREEDLLPLFELTNDRMVRQNS